MSEEIDESDPKSLHDVQYLIRFDRGEKEYDYLKEKKAKAYNDLAKKKVEDFKTSHRTSYFTMGAKIISETDW